MFNQREILKNSQAPQLNDQTIKLLTQLCFRKNDKIDKVDLVFVLGNTDFVQTTGSVRNLLNQDASGTVLITGGMPKYEDSKNLSKSEAEIILEYIKPEDYPTVEFILEKNSNNTSENVINGLKLFSKPIHTICFITRSQAAGRCYLTLRKYLPNVKILQQAFVSKYDGIKVGPENWFETEFGRSRVWGEFLRIKKYGEEGFIEFDEVKNLVNDIVRSVDKSDHMDKNVY